MNICLCGAQAGYPHDALCPFPYYGIDEKKQAEWMEAWRYNKGLIYKTRPVECKTEAHVEHEEIGS